MKLPNCSTNAARWGRPSIAALMILLVGWLERVPATRAHYHQDQAATNEIPTLTKSQHHPAGQPKNFSLFSRDVTELRLWPDLRSIKLRWTYRQADENRPESFRISYCELTSWMAEIKCRHREMPVAPAPRAPQRDSHEPLPQPAARPAPANDSNSPVITMASVQPLGPQLYETQIFDLRALTNYTFRVEVARFVDEPAPAGGELKWGASARQRPTRRLELAREAGPTQLASARSLELAQMETTKPFAAEAVKCLANSSEVLVNTGRYFGGRISVEGQQDGRCQLLGNRSSEQAAYLFHIDHQACQSKVTRELRINCALTLPFERNVKDGKRIETMILVHENKDILTHNTARFLVQCNIGQDSFTVKASISLPTVVNNLQAGQPSHRRPAMITPLGGKPSRSAAGPPEQQDFNRVHLGSMPGVYRLIRAHGEPTGALALTNPVAAPTSNYLEAAEQTARPASRSQRQSKGLGAREPPPPPPPPPPLPKPVDVSSRILFVERAGEASLVSAPMVQRESRLMLTARSALNERAEPVANLRKPQSSDHQSNETRPPALKRDNSSSSNRSDGAEWDTNREDVGEPVIMTNNHRVAGDFISLDQHLAGGAEKRAPTNDQEAEASEFSIKYSANKVHGYSLNRLRPIDGPALTTETSLTARPRAGRMLQADTSTASTSEAFSSLASGRSLASIESRMGDIAQATRLGALPGEPTSQQGEQFARVEPSSDPIRERNSSSTPAVGAQATLAHNITGAIIRWSLKTLGNLARKSLESLVAEGPEAGSEGRSGQTGARANTEASFVARGLLAPSSTAAARSGPGQKSTTRAAESAARRSLVSGSADTLHKVDGFLVNSRPMPESGSTGAPGAESASSSARQQASRLHAASSQASANSSETGDQMRTARHQQQEFEARPAQWGSKQLAPTPKLAVEQRKSVEAEASEQEPASSDRYSKESSRALWPVYTLWALCALIMSLIIAASYFVLMSPKRRTPFAAHTVASLQHHSAERPKPIGHLAAHLKDAFRRQVPMPPSPAQPNKRQPALATDDSFVAHASALGAARLASGNVGLGQQTQTFSSSPTGSAATRTTSAASSTLGSRSERENYCKEQEQYVVYTDYLVLTDDNSSLADEHEYLTGSGRRRRPASESFA